MGTAPQRAGSVADGAVVVLVVVRVLVLVVAVLVLVLVLGGPGGRASPGTRVSSTGEDPVPA